MNIYRVYTLYETRGLKCGGCNLGKNYYSDGYGCIRSGLFFHKECANSPREIRNLYHPQHVLYMKVVAEDENAHGECKVCKGNFPKMYYYCARCDFAIDLICARKGVKITIDGSNAHQHHRLFLVPEMIEFTCHLCGLLDDRFPYACNLCDLSFHKDCAESTPTLDYSCHPNHSLQRLTRVPSYTDGKCCLCENKLCNVFYHCSICNFSVDVNCAKDPPLFTLVNPAAHVHPLTFMPQRGFVCNACGMDDDPNPYVCPQCNFMIHRNCEDIPRVIKINRHRHRIRYNHRLAAGDWKCGVCHKEIKWTCGAYSCSECGDFFAHWRCATRFGIWDGVDLEGITNNTIEVKSYELIEEGVIRHFSHEDHTLKLKEMDNANSEFIWCNACTYPILSNQFYSCEECDDFLLHQNCAYLPKRKLDSFYKLPMNLISGKSIFFCPVCQNICQGFHYESSNPKIALDLRCGSISEPFYHKSHPHSLYVTNSTENTTFCNACGDKSTKFLSCEECDFNLDLTCSSLPEMVKHQNDKDHVLSLCYGEKTNEQYWCETCEEELNPEKWFYMCDHCGVTLHIKCTLGDFNSTNLTKPKQSKVNFFLNSHTTRPICYCCESRCRFPTVLRFHGHMLCSLQCFRKAFDKIM